MTNAAFPISWKEAGSGPAVVLLHGIGGGASSWTYQLAGLSSQYRMIAWDMPGYGTSEALTHASFSGLAEALLRLLDHLQLDAPHIVGHSIGGMVAQELAAIHPDRLRSLVLSATSPAFGRPDGDFQRTFIAARLGPLDAGKTMADVARSVIPELIGDAPDPEGTALAEDCMSRVPAGTYGSMMQCLVTFDRRETLGSIAVPTLVLAGEKDTQAPAPMMEKMAGRIPGAQYVCLKGAGHLANMEQPDAYNAALLDFLNRT
ncbi:MAG: alpha/beta fold hydrolase [Roseibium sp.]|nr:alpha/beta fold hydrolase [Roseibium sp.]